MKTIATVVILIIAVPSVIFSIRSALDRSRSNKTSLFGSFNGEYRDDNLGKVTPATLEGLEEAQKRKTEKKN